MPQLCRFLFVLILCAQPVFSQTSIDDPRYFVNEHYLDFLSREPDQGGLDYWASQIASCGKDQACVHRRRIDVSAAFFIELEFQETGSFIYRFYKASFGRPPSYSEFVRDRSKVVGGVNLEASKQAFAEEWVQRPEFVSKYPAHLTSTQFVDALLRTASQSSGVELSGGLAKDSRAQTVRLVVESPAFQRAEYNRAFVLMQYFGYLHRDPEQGGYDFWLNVLNNTDANNFRGMVCSFITSAEYQNRFGSTWTRSNADCSTPEQSGCVYTLSANSAQPSALGKTGMFTVKSDGSCPWRATSNAPWVTINSGRSGSGNGAINFTVAPNTGSARTGTITVGWKTFTVEQGGILSPLSTNPIEFLQNNALTLPSLSPIDLWPATMGGGASQFATNKRPVFQDGAVMFDGVDDQLDFAGPKNVRTVIMVAKHDLASLNGVQPVFLGDSTAFDFVGWSGTQLLDRSNNTVLLQGDSWLNGVKIDPRVMPKSLTEYGVYAFRLSGPATVSNLGADRGAYWFKGSIRIVEMYSTPLSDQEIESESSRLMDRFNLDTLPLVFLDGDSITASAPQISGFGYWNGAIQGADTWGAKLIPLLNNEGFGKFDLVNIAKGGQLTGDILSHATTETAPLFAASRPRKIACLLIGTNDVLGGWDPSVSFGHLVEYCNALKAAGAEFIFVGTIPSNGKNESIRNTYNLLIRAGNPAYDGVVDLASDGRLSNNKDTVYFQPDGVHLTAAGQSVVASSFAARILSAYGL